ncbi:PIG-L family deacetylase [Streptomyces genisteinicus]|uniref:PIG-L family deacetylase n=1 Tax=Streptomyces genisteinicus TaxID=2768068 RepID=A0A7H0HRW4_9ACTN|nr:PIG-L family deacetylase [Streptomyces genisteinicus]QNP63280.1 PIG-L family deacetylase [Streptomyces genisteinicus]
MQIVAHPDDDLFFMNPDVAQTVESGVPVTSVYITDGGSFGVNKVPGRPAPAADVPGYVSARQQGLRQAYAQMMGLPLFTPWERGTVRLPGGREAELNRLEHLGRRVDLVFLNLRMHARAGGKPVNLTHLWRTPGVRLPTQPAPGSPAGGPSSYGHGELVEALVALLRRYRPTLIRTLDPDPDAQVHDRRHPRGSDQRGYSDHPDHTAAALFAWRALTAWAAGPDGAAGAPAFQTEAYRGYYNQRWPHNLPARTVALKTRHLNAYGGDPSWGCGNDAGCGDYAIGGDRVLASDRGWVRSTHRRYPTAGPRAVVDADDGRTTVYGVLGTRLARWSGRPDGTPADPEDLGGGHLAPAIAVTTAAGGDHLVFALRFAGLGPGDRENVREVVVLRQRPRGDGPAGTWQSLGSPETEPRRTRLTGTPVAVTGADGRVHLFVRNGHKGVSTRVLGTGGTWSAWRRLPGGHVQEGLAAAVDGDGRVHLFAASTGWTEHWAQRGVRGRLRRGSRRLVARPGDVPDAVTAADGSVLVGYRRVASDRVIVERLAPGRLARWSTVTERPVPGYGRVALVGGRRPTASDLRIAVGGGAVGGPDGDGTVLRAAVPSAAAPVQGVPTTAVAPGGGPAVMVALGLDGTPVVTRIREGGGSA